MATVKTSRNPSRTVPDWIKTVQQLSESYVSLASHDADKAAERESAKRTLNAALLLANETQTLRRFVKRCVREANALALVSSNDPYSHAWQFLEAAVIAHLQSMGKAIDCEVYYSMIADALLQHYGES